MDDLQLIFLSLSTQGTFAIVYLNLPNKAISLPLIPPLAQQIGGGVIASVIAGLTLQGLFTRYNNSTTNGSGGMLEDVTVGSARKDTKRLLNEKVSQVHVPNVRIPVIPYVSARVAICAVTSSLISLAFESNCRRRDSSCSPSNSASNSSSTSLSSSF